MTKDKKQVDQNEKRQIEQDDVAPVRSRKGLQVCTSLRAGARC